MSGADLDSATVEELAAELANAERGAMFGGAGRSAAWWRRYRGKVHAAFMAKLRADNAAAPPISDSELLAALAAE